VANYSFTLDALTLNASALTLGITHLNEFFKSIFNGLDQIGSERFHFVSPIWLLSIPQRYGTPIYRTPYGDDFRPYI
jgi:hypothetical protein